MTTKKVTDTTTKLTGVGWITAAYPAGEGVTASGYGTGTAKIGKEKIGIHLGFD